MDDTSNPSWQRYWASLRHRRIAVVAALPLTIPIWIIFGGVVGVLTSAVAFSFALHALRTWPCPRCGDPFVGVRWDFFPEQCASCQLPSFVRPDIVRRTDFARAPTVRTLSDRLRRSVAGAEIAGGALVISATAFAGGLPLWYRLALESVGAVALAAGIWLWRDDARGYTWSRFVQALQLVRVAVPPIAYSVSAGPSVDLYFGSAAAGFNLGLAGQLVLLWQYTGPVRVSFNMLAVTWLLILLDARPRITARPTGLKAFEVSWEGPDDGTPPPGGPSRDEPASEAPPN